MLTNTQKQDYQNGFRHGNAGEYESVLPDQSAEYYLGVQDGSALLAGVDKPLLASITRNMGRHGVKVPS